MRFLSLFLSTNASGLRPFAGACVLNLTNGQESEPLEHSPHTSSTSVKYRRETDEMCERMKGEKSTRLE